MRYIVVVSKMTGPVEVLARTLASAVGKTAYEMRARASVPHGGPTIIGTYGTHKMALAVATQLRSADFNVQVDTPEAFITRWQYRIARRIELGDTVTIEDRLGARFTVPAAGVQAIISGMGHWTETQEETQTTRKFNAKRAVMSGGLLLTKKSTTTQVKTVKGGSRFLAIYIGAHCVLLKEEEMLYDRLGALMQPSRTANFMMVQQEIKRRFSQAKFDARLLTRLGQSQVLSTLFTPEENGDLAAALVAQTLTE